MRNFDSLSEREILALAISLEEEDESGSMRISPRLFARNSRHRRPSSMECERRNRSTGAVSWISHPLLGRDHLCRIRSGRQDLRDQCVGVECNRSDQLLQLFGSLLCSLRRLLRDGGALLVGESAARAHQHKSPGKQERDTLPI